MNPLKAMIRDIEVRLRKVLYRPPPEPTPHEERLAHAEEKVEKLTKVVDALDQRVGEIERSPDPWVEFLDSVRGGRHRSHH